MKRRSEGSEKYHPRFFSDWKPRLALIFLAFACARLENTTSASKTSTSNFAGQCDEPLGLESGALEDHNLLASSSFDTHSTGPHNARLNKDKNGGAWCPKDAVNSDSS